jgi:hypothetical protein
MEQPTWRHPGLIFVYETSPIFRGVLMNLMTNLKKCGTLPTFPCFARGPWEKGSPSTISSVTFQSLEIKDDSIKHENKIK